MLQICALIHSSPQCVTSNMPLHCTRGWMKDHILDLQLESLHVTNDRQGAVKEDILAPGCDALRR